MWDAGRSGIPELAPCPLLGTESQQAGRLATDSGGQPTPPSKAPNLRARGDAPRIPCPPFFPLSACLTLLRHSKPAWAEFPGHPRSSREQPPRQPPLLLPLLQGSRGNGRLKVLGDVTFALSGPQIRDTALSDNGKGPQPLPPTPPPAVLCPCGSSHEEGRVFMATEPDHGGSPWAL